MYVFDYRKRVRYAETDKMGYLYYGHYAKYYEIGRVECLRHLGLSYKLMEDQYKIMLPVVHLESKYLLPAYYDEEILIKTILKEMPGKMITFHHELINPKSLIINKAIVKLFFVDMESGKRTSVPGFLKDKLLPYFKTGS
ncbi:MAG: acyl-CoA thioesterase [Saprospiraceae bacterium]|nr:acyl-CoA thioesterase [Bacteroidia bacterium]NNK90594.1 acyl-CoA thioesterase [Saprospiraceae bacterium]